MASRARSGGDRWGLSADGYRAYSGTSSSVLKLDSEFPNNVSFSDHWIVLLKMLKVILWNGCQ